MANDGTRWLKMGQAMRRISVCRETMRRYCREETVRAEKLPSGHWRIAEDSLDALMGGDAHKDALEYVRSLGL